ncbi:MAG: hypothetical protein EOM37_07790 [Proteobacteria bacterium]|jgi:uncharacterized heparinase superfamily protein|nr:heparinase II/III family protein [Alphaproteobacteria bacterium]NCC03931.1 hypothetical protein [Pseudomonadota bacterium]
MESPTKMLQQIRKRVQTVTYGSVIYRHILDQGPVPERLRLTIADLWPGDSKKGQALIANQPGLFEMDAVGREACKVSFLTHDCLRDLRAVGSDMAKRKAVALLHEWIEEQESWNEEQWLAPYLGARLANWIAFYDFYGSMVTDAFRPVLLVHMVRQLRHLINIAPANLIGRDNLCVVKGLVYGGLGLLDSEKALGLALELLSRQLKAEILPDGGHISRNPQHHADVLRLLIDIRAGLYAGRMEIPLELTLAITRMVPALKFFKHGDGGLALFNGGREADALLLEALLTLSGVKTRGFKRLPHMGYERLTAGRSLLIVDASGPPQRPFDADAHAGLLSFEFSVGRERILTNCGAAPRHAIQWRSALAATAAHNTVTYDNINACEILTDGGVGHRPDSIAVQRYEQDSDQFIELAHDGYMHRHKVYVRRSLCLAADGDELKGMDVIEGPIGSDFTIRWHLHPSINVMLAQGGTSALLRTPSGGGWRLRVNGPYGQDLALETSIYYGQDVPRRTFQLRVSARLKEMAGVVEWSLVREKTKKGIKK